MIKVVHCINGLNVGGAEMMLYKVATRMSPARVSSVVVSLIAAGAVGERIQQAGIPVIAFDKIPGVPDLRMVWHLYRLLCREQPDLVQTHMYEANLYGVMAAKLARMPVIWGIRCADMDFSQYRRRSRLAFDANRQLSGLPNAIVVNSRAGKAYHIAQGFDGRRMVVIPNGFELESFQPNAEQRRAVRAELGIGEDALLVGRVARFDPMKDYSALAQAGGQIVKKYPNVFFVFIGGDVTTENSDLMNWIQASGLTGRVFLLGQRDDIPRLTASLDIAVSSSLSEGFPNVVGEAMACGVPCVVTDVGDSAFLVGDTGRIVPPKNPDALAAAITELIAMTPAERQRLGQAARQRVAENFEIGAVTRQLEKLYADVIAKKKLEACVA